MNCTSLDPSPLATLVDKWTPSGSVSGKPYIDNPESQSLELSSTALIYLSDNGEDARLTYMVKETAALCKTDPGP